MKSTTKNKKFDKTEHDANALLSKMKIAYRYRINDFNRVIFVLDCFLRDNDICFYIYIYDVGIDSLIYSMNGRCGKVEAQFKAINIFSKNMEIIKLK